MKTSINLKLTETIIYVKNKYIIWKLTKILGYHFVKY